MSVPFHAQDGDDALDDAARGDADRHALARALVALSTGERPEIALGAGDTAALERVRRLIRPAGPSR